MFFWEREREKEKGGVLGRLCVTDYERVFKLTCTLTCFKLTVLLIDLYILLTIYVSASRDHLLI